MLISTILAERPASLGPALAAGLGLLFVYYAYVYVSRVVLARKHGCKAPKQFPLFEGWSMFLQIRRREQRHEVTTQQQNIHDIHGTTFELVELTERTLYTKDPLNVREIWAASFRDWGVEKQRIKVLGPFCGRGLATVDGEQWKRTRKIIRPHFYGPQSAPADLDAFDLHIKEMLQQLPPSGEIVDMQPLIYDLVRFP